MREGNDFDYPSAISKSCLCADGPLPGAPQGGWVNKKISTFIVFCNHYRYFYFKTT